MLILDGLICCVDKQTHHLELNTKNKFSNKLSTDGKFLDARTLSITTLCIMLFT
jgi:hypothetical protein